MLPLACQSEGMVSRTKQNTYLNQKHLSSLFLNIPLFPFLYSKQFFLPTFVSQTCKFTLLSMSIQQPDVQLATDLRTVISRLIKKLRTKNTTGEKLSLTERSVLSLLDEHKEMLPGELATAEKITSQSMSAILNHLSELGYIKRKSSATDKRKVLVSLTKEGQNILYKRRHERDEWLSHAIQETFTQREQEMLRKMIEPLSRLIDIE
jgi:DNA-binding MarR family transcriptional regulator